MNKDQEMLERELTSNRPDYTFNPNLLNSLNSEDRKRAETVILVSCLCGIKSSYKYIPYLKLVDVEDTITPKVISDLPLDCKIQAVKNLFLKTGNMSYLERLITIARTSPQAYKELFNIVECIENSSTKNLIKSQIDIINAAQKDDINYKFIYDNNNNQFDGDSSFTL